MKSKIENVQNLSLAVKSNEKLEFPFRDSHKSSLLGKLRYWWSLSVAGVLLLFGALPMMIILQIINRQIWLYPFCMWGAKKWIRLSGAKVEVRGQENLEADKSYIFAANHKSYIDTTALFAYTGKKVGLIAKKEILKVPVLGRGIGFINFLTIDRSNPERAKKTLDRARELVESGYSFGIFAEGTRAMPGELLPFKKGAFHLAIQTGAAVVPVVFKNTDYIMGKKTGVVNPATMEIVLLPPIETKNLTEENDLMNLLEKTRAAIALELENDKTKMDNI